MKRTLLSFAMLLIGMGAWAQTVVTEINPDKIYTLECRSGAAHSTSRFIGYNEGKINGQSSSPAYFKFEAATGDNAYYIYCVDAEKYLNHDGSNISASVEKATSWILGVPSHTQGVVTFTIGNNKYLNNNGSDCQDGSCSSLKANTHNGGPGANNACSLWEMKQFDAPVQKITVNYSYKYNGKEVATQKSEVFPGYEYPQLTVSLPYGFTGSKPTGSVDAAEAVDGVIVKDITLTKTAELPFAVAADFNSIEHWYYLNIRDTDPTYLKYESDVNFIKAADAKSVVDASDDKDAYTWAFVGDVDNPFAGFQIVNYKTGATMVLSSPAVPTGNTNAGEVARMVIASEATGNKVWTIMSPTHGGAPEGAFYIQHPTAASYAFNRQAIGGKNALAYWTGRDTGSALQVVERAMGPVSELRLLIEDVEEIEAGDNIGDYTAESVAALKQAITDAKAKVESGNVTQADIDTLQAAIDALKIVLPDFNKFYVLRCNHENRYIYVNSANKLQWTGAAPTEVASNYVWQFSEGSTPNTVKMMSVHTQSYLNTVNNGYQAAFGDGVDVSIKKSSVVGACVFEAGNAGIGLHAHGTGNTVIGYTNGAGANHYFFEEVSELSHTLTVGASGWATLMLGYNATIPAGAEVYAVSETTSKSAKLQLVADVVPANEAVLIKANEGSYSFVYTTTEGNVAGNLLEGTLYTKNVAAEAYVLSNVDGEVAFRLAALTDGAFQNNANKAYLPKTSSARFLSFDFGTETVIDELKGENGNVKTVIYDLSGRSVQKAQKGLYIVNGVKVIK